jgi:hypothetical protein
MAPRPATPRVSGAGGPCPASTARCLLFIPSPTLPSVLTPHVVLPRQNTRQMHDPPRSPQQTGPPSCTMCCWSGCAQGPPTTIAWVSGCPTAATWCALGAGSGVWYGAGAVQCLGHILCSGSLAREGKNCTRGQWLKAFQACMAPRQPPAPRGPPTPLTRCRCRQRQGRVEPRAAAADAAGRLSRTPGLDWRPGCAAAAAAAAGDLPLLPPRGWGGRGRGSGAVRALVTLCSSLPAGQTSNSSVTLKHLTANKPREPTDLCTRLSCCLAAGRGVAAHAGAAQPLQLRRCFRPCLPSPTAAFPSLPLPADAVMLIGDFSYADDHLSGEPRRLNQWEGSGSVA